MKRTFVIKSLFLPVLFLFLFFSNGSKAYARLGTPTDLTDPCQPYEGSWKLTIWKAIDVQNTIENLLTGITNSLFAKVFGANTNDVIACESTVLTTGHIANNMCSQLGFSTVCSEQPDTKATCEEITNVTKTAYMYDGKPTNLLAIDASLVGVSNRIEDTALRDPIAVNLAYYWKSQVAKVPLIGRSYAATLGDTTNGMAIIQAGLSVWQFCRNISLAFMAVILMYTGLTIIMRKKMNTQLVVTVQYAIPKIIIGLILILFSYPIGAAITGLSWGLFRSSTDIIVNALYGGSVQPANFSKLVLLGLVIGGLKMGYFGGIGFILVVLVAVATVVIEIVVYIKAILIYLKMVFSTIIAPFELALGTVPGSEDRIKDWFLKMAKYGITIFAMGLIIPVTLVMAFNVLMYYSCRCPMGAACNIETAGMGTFLMVTVPLVIVIMGFSLALKMESVVDEMIFGGGKPKKR